MPKNGDDEPNVEADDRIFEQFAARDPLRRTDLGNAERFSAQHRDTARYCPSFKSWLAWDNTRWARNDTLRAEALAEDTVRSIYGEAAANGTARARRNLAMWGTKSEQGPRVREMLKLAQPMLAIDPSNLDRDPWLFNVVNGTLDLRTGELRTPHPRDDLITKLAPVAYDPGERSDEWDNFIKVFTCGDEELAGYLRRLAGYALTGVLRERRFHVLLGDGSNGKSTFRETLLEMMGDYAVPATPALLFGSKYGQGDANVLYDQADIAGARLLTCVENENENENKKWSLARINALTGGDTDKGRAAYGRSFTRYRGDFKILVQTNGEPTLKEDTQAVLTRLRIIPCKARMIEANDADDFDELPPNSVVDDLAFRDRLREHSLPAVLAWAVEGAKEWLRDGLGECKAITDATRNALAKSRSAKRDLFATAVHRFIAECCVVGDQFSESTTAMLPVFTEFATAKGFLAKNDINITAFGRALNDAGYPVGRTPTLGRQKRRQGLKLRDDQRQGAA